MDKEQKKAAADKAVNDATSALDTAKAAVDEAKKGNDGEAVKQAEGKVKDATESLTKAQSERKALDEESGADDLIDDALNPKRKLSDGSDADKKIEIAHDKFTELNEQAKLFQQFAPVLARLQKNPDLAKKLMEGDDPNKSLEDRIAAIEEKERTAKTTEVKEVITKAVATWGADFKGHWDSVKALLPGLEASGLPYAEAVQRAYFAVNPEAAKGDKRLLDAQARNKEGKRGQFAPAGGGHAPIAHRDQEPEYAMNEADAEFARVAGIDPALYAKHARHIEKFADL